MTFVVLFAPCKGIQDSLVFWIPRHGFRIPATGFHYLSVERGFWIPIVNGIPDFFILSFPGVVFRIPEPRIPDSTIKSFPDSRIQILIYGAILFKLLSGTFQQSLVITGAVCYFLFLKNEDLQ